jgi:hypothetical protein
MLSHQEKTSILSRFPNIKLSYENITHKKVSNYDIILAIPEGKKCFAWFTKYQEKNVCFIMELAENKQIFNIKIVNTIFKNDVVISESIFYGTLFNNSNNNFFCIEDIFYYKRTDISKNTWVDKFKLLKEILKNEQKQILLPINNHFVIFGLPILSNHLDEVMDKIKKIKYKIKCIQFRSFHKYSQFLFTPYEFLIHLKKNSIELKAIENILTKTEYTQTSSKRQVDKNCLNNQNYRKKKDVVFHVKADIQNDIYHLYCNNENRNTSLLNYKYYNTAFIPNFTSSVMMNKLFRNIKENINLDALEESDDEDEFQNEKIDRFVNLDLSYNMICSYNYKFKKWFPIRLAESHEKIVNQYELTSILENPNNN